MKLSRKSIEQGLTELPMSAILGKQVSDALTPKQRDFARKVAQGKSKAQAYREAFNPNPAPSTLVTTPYKVAADPRVQREIEAYALAIEAAKHRTPAALRSLVIRGLVEIALKDDTKDSVKVQALKTLGTVTEVAAFTERKEVRSITSSDDARARVMAELRGILTAQAQDATVIEADADSLLRELSGVNINAEPAININGDTGDTRETTININGEPLVQSEEADGATPPTPDPPAAAGGVPRP